MSARNNSQREATAYHEAGHAVIARALGYRPKAVTIIPTCDAHGVVHYPNPLRGIRLDIDMSDRARQRVERTIQILFAGPLAQQHLRPSSWRRWHGKSDFDTAVDLALRVCGSGEQATAFLRWLEIMTRETIEARWPQIGRVAAALLERERLTADEIIMAIQ